MQVTFNITRGHTIALFKVITLSLLLGFGIQFLFAWTAPTVTAPGGNVDGPLTTGTGEQFKQGPLTINADVLPSTVGSAYGLVVSQNMLVGGKVLSGSTLDGDPGQTLVTKDYLDSRVSNSGGSGLPGLSCETVNTAGTPGTGKATATCPADTFLTGGGCNGFVPGSNGIPNYTTNAFYCSNTSTLDDGNASARCCKVTATEPVIAPGTLVGACTHNWGGKQYANVTEPAYGTTAGCKCREGYKLLWTGTCDFGTCPTASWNKAGTEIYFYTCMKS